MLIHRLRILDLMREYFSTRTFMNIGQKMIPRPGSLLMSVYMTSTARLSLLVLRKTSLNTFSNYILQPEMSQKNMSIVK